MGILGKILGTQEKYPPLTEDNPAVPQLRKDIKGLESLACSVKEKIEVLPGASGTSVLIGRPPWSFGLVWVEGRQVKDFRTVVSERGIAPGDVKPLMARLRRAYRENREAKRFSAKIARRKVVVTPGCGLAREMEKIVREIPA